MGKSLESFSPSFFIPTRHSIAIRPSLCYNMFMDKNDTKPKTFDCFFTWPYLIRFLVAFIVLFIGFKSNIGYVHLCTSGFKFIEYGAPFVAGWLPCLLILVIPKYRINLSVSLFIILTIYLLQRPYLDAIH